MIDEEMIMDFRNSLAYTRLLAKGVAEINRDFRRLAKMSTEDRFDAILEMAGDLISFERLDPACFVTSVDGIDEFEYELHMTLQADMDNYLFNEVADLIRLKKEVIF
jgi:hypothetical protein